MDCARSIELLSEYSAGSLGEADSLFMSTHLSACADCSGVLQDLRLIVEAAAAMRAENGVAYPDEEVFWQRLNARRIVH
jgi:anti-sigma factor ChrR (cupin superfamily)